MNDRNVSSITPPENEKRDPGDFAKELEDQLKNIASLIDQLFEGTNVSPQTLNLFCGLIMRPKEAQLSFMLENWQHAKQLVELGILSIDFIKIPGYDKD